MKTIFKVYLSLIAIAAFTFSSVAQNISVSENWQTEPYGQAPLPEVGGTTITHSLTQTITSGNSVACWDIDGTTGHYDNGYWRAFDLPSFAIIGDFSIFLVEIGIEAAFGGIGGVQPVTCNLYITDGTPFPSGFPGSLITIGSLTLDVPDQAITIFPIPISGVAPAGSELVVEIFAPEGTTDGNFFFIGSNPDGQTAPSYISSDTCGIPDPLTTSDIGFPDMHIVMNVTGDDLVPVELTSFTANVNNEGNVILNWSTATELNNQMFEIERKSIESSFTTLGFVEGYGTTTESQEYSYIDKPVETGTYFYRLKQIDFGGQYEYSDEIEVEVNGPLTFGLQQNYPNPFNPSTLIKYSIPENGFVKLSVYNLVGEEVSVLVNEEVGAGFYEVEFNANNFPSGTYFYRLQAGNTVQLMKMVLMK